jgi:A-macroglobulin TED domain/Alpha-2-macroglobulin family/Carboxypeptidase regulatory-like domain/MG2 domain/A-macroglobulin receptor binding domain
MIWRVTSLVLMAALSSAVHSTIVAQASNSPHPISIIETRAEATLGQKSIRVELPLSAPASGSERVIAWVLSPANLASGESAVALHTGEQTATLTLPGPNDSRGQPVDDIGWYRIGYRIETGSAPVAHGIFSVGAITSNLLALRLARPAALFAGMPINVRIFAGNPVTRQPFKGVRLKATLVLDDDSDSAKPSKRNVVRNAVTDAAGEATFVFPSATSPLDSPSLKVEGTLANRGGSGAFAHASLSADIDVTDRSTIHAETDKPLHKPGETVHLRALVLKDSGHAAADTDVTLTISDSDNKTVEEVPLKTNHFGIAFYDWKTTQQTATGDYTAGFEIGEKSDYGRGTGIPLRIERYDLPEFVVSARLDSGYYLAGQTPTVKIHAEYLFGKPVAAGAVKIARSGEAEWNPKTRKYEKPETTERAASLDPSGDAEFKLEVKDEFEKLGERSYDRYTDLQYRAIVTDASTGRSEPRNFTVRLSHDPVHIYVTPMGGTDREGDYFVSTSYADGAPAACEVTLDWMDDEKHPVHAGAGATNRYGLAKIHLVYPADEELQDSFHSRSLRVRAVDREGRTSTFDDTVNPVPSNATWITVGHSLLRPSDPIEATVHGPSGDTIDVDVLSETGLLAHLRARPEHGAASLTIPAGPAFHGLITLRAYTFASEDDDYNSYSASVSNSSKSVLYPEDRELRVMLTGLKTSYSPGAEVSALLNVNDAAGAFPRSAAGVSVFDTAVQQRAETEEEANQSWFGDYWWLGGSVAGGLTRAALDKTDASKPIPSDLDLAAEAVLRNESSGDVVIETSGDSSARTGYSNTMERDLKPLGSAIEGYSSVRLPGTLDSVREAVRILKLDESLLVDPWNTPYRVATSIPWNDEQVQFTSAGPDKRFGTSDDFSLTVARRNIFAIPGRRLSEILKKTAAADRSLPGTTDTLKALAKAGGLDLDSAADGTVAPDGTPYKYAISVSQSQYSVVVTRGDSIRVWMSEPIHYFEHTEARMNAALRSWEDAGHPFPAKESEAREAFAAAGIEFDTLRDPFGRPFQLVCERLTTYSTNQHVAAGKTLQVTDQSVSRTMQAVQVMRRSEANGVPYYVETVAQFLHPVADQGGGDIKPKPVEQGTFKGNTGAISGTVADRTGAVIPNATVTATDAGGNEFTISSTEKGTYLLRNLTPGLYGLKVVARGFQEFAIRDVHVSAASRTTVDVTLDVGSTSQTVTVTAEAVSELATSSANVSSLAKLAPGADGGRDARVVSSSTGRALITEPTFTPRLRHVFEETAYWAPSLETDAAGRTGLRFRLPDSLTTWKLHAIASTADGRMGALDQTFKTFQPFFVDLDAPQVLTQGDEITLPVNLRNYMAQNLTLPVTVKPADWLAPLGATTFHISVPANGSAPFNFGFRAAKTVDQGPLQISAASATTGDAVEKQVRVHPDGEPGSATVSGLLHGQSTTMEIDLPANLISGSLLAEVRLYPNLGAQIVHAIKASLERPYGCGEQTISSTYPSLLFLELLKASNTKSPVGDEAQTYLQLGYDRLQSYFDVGGGLTYWGGSDHNPDPALTAYGVAFLLEADPFMKVDHERIARALRWLIDHQQGDGSWAPHYGSASPDLALYVAASLSRAAASSANDVDKDLNARIKAAIAKALEWASRSVDAAHDPYANALRLQLAADAGDSAGITRLRDELASTAVKDRSGTHWTRGGYSPFYGWGRAGDLETTAQVLSALRAKETGTLDSALVNDALSFLVRSHDRYGIWYSGQATVRALQALFPFAAEQMKSSGEASNFSLSVNGTALSAHEAAALHADPRLLEAPRLLDISSMLKPGHNALVFTGTTDNGLASAEISALFYTPWTSESLQVSKQTQPGKDYGLDFGYQCGALDASPGKPVQCTVEARRFGSRSYGMLLAEVGLPPGADVDRASLAKLLSDWTISRYELQPDRIVFYLWSWRPEGAHFSFTFTPRYAIHAKAAPATLFDFYNPDLKVVLAPQTFAVQ